MTGVISDELRSYLPETGLVLILGAPGKGKSCLAYGILHERASRGQSAYVYGLPLERAPLLPDEIRPIAGLELPEHSAVLSDEAYLSFHARNSMSQRSRFIDAFAGLVRQKDILGIYVTQLSRKLDIGLVSSASCVLIKEPSLLQMKFDRSELRAVLAVVKRSFRALRPPTGVALEEYAKRCTYVMADDYEGMLEDTNSPPPFWSDELSKPYAGISLLNPMETLPQRNDILCIDPTCNQPAVGICACHQNSYCQEHMEGHQVRR